MLWGLGFSLQGSRVCDRGFEVLDRVLGVGMWGFTGLVQDFKGSGFDGRMHFSRVFWFGMFAGGGFTGWRDRRGAYHSGT